MCHCVINNPTTVELCISPVYTCCRNCSRDPDHASVAAPEGKVEWALAFVRQPNAEGVRNEAPRGRGAAGAETSAEGARVEAP